MRPEENTRAERWVEGNRPGELEAREEQRGELVFTVTGTVLAGRAALSARQLLVINLLTDVAPAPAPPLRPPTVRNPEALIAEGPDALVLAAGFGSAAALAGIVQAPGVSQFLGCTPDPFAWAVASSSATVATVASVVAAHLTRRVVATRPVAPPVRQRRVRARNVPRASARSNAALTSAPTRMAIPVRNSQKMRMATPAKAP